MATIDNERLVRADPDALLSAIHKKKIKRRGGRIYLYIGMAPGVGKTYAMLLAAREARRSGVDVVVGVVESHGREETQALLEGLEIIPKMKLEHRNVTFYEMDLDAILKRKPMIALVDELAHTNIPGARHSKRWQDVFELLDAGIDVYSTLNVQHLESRKDSVEEIAKITVSETVPDSVLDRAFQIQLIDLSVPDLLRRLKEGKVYLGEKAELAASHFFKEEKLTALREIALRVAADRVDAELQTFATEREAGTFWPTADRLIVGVGFCSQTDELIRASRRLAYNLDAPWIALHVSSNELVSPEQRDRLAKNLELARNLGAEIITVADTNVVDALIRVARQKDVSQIIVGRSRKTLKNLFGRRSTHEQLIAKSTIDVCVLGPKPKDSHRPFDILGPIRIRSTLASYTKALVFTGALTALNAAIAPFIGYRAVGFLFLTGILMLGLFVPIGTVLFAALISMLGWNFFFIPPTGAFHMSKPEDIYLCMSYFGAALVTGILTRRNKYQQEILITREIRSEALSHILFDIATETTSKGVCSSVTKHIATFLKGECDVMLLKKDNDLSPFVEQRLKLTNLNREMAVAKWAIDNNKAAGLFTDTLSSAEALYIPLKGTFEMMGVLAYQAKKSNGPSVEDMDFLFSVSHQIAISLEKLKFRKRALESERLAESERTHQILLELLEAEIKWFLSNPKQNIEKLNFTMDNFLLASRLSVGIFPLKKMLSSQGTLIDGAINKVRAIVSDKPFKVAVHGDGNLANLMVEHDSLVQALANVLLNAVQYGAGKEVTVELRPQEIIICDQGPGVKEDDLGRIFEKFYRSLDSNKEGYGLGLYLAKGVIKAHNGKISAKNRPTGGLAITIILPEA